MFSGMPALNHQEQQEAVERIHQLMADGMSSGEAIALVAQEIREKHKDKEQIHARLAESNKYEYNKLLTFMLKSDTY
ncbi:YoaH family protein [Providencia vermicola]|uniref:YoaH family protein n=1 Tax=Providencia vermicola TaxID=333965 RepID=UPI0034DCE1C2